MTPGDVDVVDAVNGNDDDDDDEREVPLMLLIPEDVLNMLLS